MLFDFDKGQRIVIAEKVMELSNLAVAALVIGQVLAGRFDFRAAGFGLVLFLVGYIVAFFIMKGGGEK